MATRRVFAAHCSALFVSAVCGALGTAHAAAPPTQKPPAVLVLGDSLSAEYGLARGTGWVALMTRRIAQQGFKTQVVNASISGETTSGGRSRLPALLREHQPRIVIVELGGNDALRGLPLSMTEANLQAIVETAKGSGAKVIVVGMAVPPNYGRRYGDDFMGLFGKVAKTERVALVPFLLHGVADVPQAEKLFQADGIHPKAEAHPRMLENVWPVLLPLLR